LVYTAITRAKEKVEIWEEKRFLTPQRSLSLDKPGIGFARGAV
jgi:ATP-dependent exoDNAse (exonuclease V) alpha subunit